MLYESVNIPLWRNLKHLTGLKFLDIGCGTGALAELLVKNGNYVEGITHFQEEATIASGRMHKVHLLDLNDDSSIRSTIHGNFDALLFAGVLEHLINPVATLKTFETYCGKGCKVYVSLPNIACFYVRFGLLMGEFDMLKEGGILDETHLHHYTLKTAKEMIKSTGLKIDKIDFMPGLSVWIYQNLLKKKESGNLRKMSSRRDFQFYERYVYPLERFFSSLWRCMFANEFQFICRLD